MDSPKRDPATEDAAVYRVRMRAAGPKPKVIRVPDQDAHAFREEARRQPEAAAASDMADDDKAFIDSLIGELFRDLDVEEGSEAKPDFVCGGGLVVGPQPLVAPSRRDPSPRCVFA